MTLGDTRSAIVGMLTEHRPTMDFSVPDKVLDFHIFNEASRMAEEEVTRKRSPFFLVQPWMITNLICLPIEDAPYDCYIPKACKTRYRISLPSKVAEIGGAMGVHQVLIQNSNVTFRYIPWGHIGHADNTEYPPSTNHPAYSFLDDVIYLWGGTRDLSQCRAQVDYVSGSAIQYDGQCPDGETKLGIPPGTGSTLIRRVYELMTVSEQQQESDLIDDGVDQSQPNQP